MPPSTSSKEAVARLLQAWRGEVQARALYNLLADRVGDPRRAEVIRAIADAEASHRERIEQRLRELGEPVPDPAGVRLSLMQRMQARIAPVPTVMARMEAAEEVEIQDRYKRSTGDPETDAVLQSIRVEEQGHSRSLEAIQAAHRGAESPRAARRPSSTGSWAGRPGTAPGRAGSRARSMAPMTGWPRFSASSRECRARPAARDSS